MFPPVTAPTGHKFCKLACRRVGSLFSVFSGEEICQYIENTQG